MWERDLGVLGGEPGLAHADSRTSDYTVEHWAQAHALLLLGDDAAFALSTGDGRILGQFTMRPVGKASLETSGIHLDPSGAFAALVSAKRVWILDDMCRIHARVETGSLLSRSPRFDDGCLLVAEHDFAGAPGATNTRRIPLCSPTA
ncbi:hypothetical protein ABT160_28645 [Streptomyces sp. NPDC001941]|uniref:hypothetical protein n=1 Tax=Streptomyces sp. NPDC001941 TaxID=3154659 RepID=UPI00331C87DB